MRLACIIFYFIFSFAYSRLPMINTGPDSFELGYAYDPLQLHELVISESGYVVLLDSYSSASCGVFDETQHQAHGFLTGTCVARSYGTYSSITYVLKSSLNSDSIELLSFKYTDNRNCSGKTLARYFSSYLTNCRQIRCDPNDKKSPYIYRSVYYSPSSLKFPLDGTISEPQGVFGVNYAKFKYNPTDICSCKTIHRCAGQSLIEISTFEDDDCKVMSNKYQTSAGSCVTLGDFTNKSAKF